MSEKKTCFVAFSYSDPYNKRYRDIYEGAITAAGATPCRADEHLYRGNIPPQILSLIQKADMFFADISVDNRAVLLELGYAMRCKLPIIRVCHKDSQDSLSVYERNEVTIFYTNESRSDFDALEKRLTAAIRKTLSELSDVVATGGADAIVRPRRKNSPLPPLSRPYVSKNWKKHYEVPSQHLQGLRTSYAQVMSSPGVQACIKAAERIPRIPDSAIRAMQGTQVLSSPGVQACIKAAERMPRIPDSAIRAMQGIHVPEFTTGFLSDREESE